MNSIDLKKLASLLPNQTTFGVELEVVGVNQYDAMTYLKEINPLLKGYTHEVPVGGWHVVSDNSLHLDDCDRDKNDDFWGCDCWSESLELVSPVLQGFSGFTSLKKATMGLTKAGCYTNHWCGTHVHVGGQEFFDDFNRMWRILDRYVGLGLQMQAGRDGGKYASPIMPDDIYEYLRIFEKIRFDNFNAVYRHDMRRTAVNFCSLYKNDNAARTVEFRQLAGTTNTETICNWIVAVTNLIEEVRNWAGCAKCNSSDHAGVVFCKPCRDFFCEADNHICEFDF